MVSRCLSVEHEGGSDGASRSSRARQRLLDAVPIAHPAARTRRPRRDHRRLRPRPGQAREGRHAARPLDRRRQPGGAARSRRRRCGADPDEHERARLVGPCGARSRQARAPREAHGDVLEEAQAVLESSRRSSRLLVCAPHIALSPTYREMHRRVQGGGIGRLVLARSRYGWPGTVVGKVVLTSPGAAASSTSAAFTT